VLVGFGGYSMPDKLPNVQVFKCQRSLYPRNANVLIYNISRDIEFTMVWEPIWAQMFGSRSKIYISASYQKGVFQIIREVAEQDW
jgi:hypothetical protein